MHRAPEPPGRSPLTRRASIAQLGAMDRKTKKRLEVLKKKRANVRTQLVTVRKFTDDSGELQALEADLAKIVAEIEKLEGGQG